MSGGAQPQLSQSSPGVPTENTLFKARARTVSHGLKAVATPANRKTAKITALQFFLSSSWSDLLKKLNLARPSISNFLRNGLITIARNFSFSVYFLFS